MLPGLKEVIEERLKIGRDNKQKDEEGGINNDNNNRNNNNNNDVIISFCNFGFVDFVLNLVHCFNHLKINNYLIFSLDIQSHEALQKHNIASYYFKKEDAVYTESSSNFGEVGFKAICNEKPFLILEVIKLGFNTCWTDSDIVWLDNAMDYFKGDYDLFVQRDDDDICAGFFFIKSKPITINFMTKVVDYLNPMIDDQISMRRFLKEEKEMTFIELDRVLFPNGTAYFNMKLPQKLNQTPVIIHNNCFIGHDSKKERFKLHGLWFIDENNVNVTANDDVPIKECTKILKGHFDVVTSIHVIGDTLYSASLDKNIILWDYKNGNRIGVKGVHARGAVWGMASNNHFLFTSSHDRTCQAWDTKEWKSIKSYVGHSTIVNCVSYSTSKNMIFTGSDDQSVRGYDFTTGEKKRIYTGHTGWVTSMHTEGGVLFTSSNDRSARAWEISTGRELVVYQGHTAWVRSVVSDSSNNVVFTASNDHSIRCWNMRDGTTLKIMKGHTGGVSSLVLDKSNNNNNYGILYSGSDDNTIRAWHAKSGECLGVYRGHTGWVTGVVVAGDHLISSSFDKTIRIWPKIDSATN